MGRNRKYERQDVLNNAMGLFWQNGFLATSMSEMTKVTGLNTASMYKEFDDKDGLFVATLDLYRSQIMLPRFQILIEQPNMRGVEAFLGSVVSGASKEEYKGCLMMNHLAQKHAICPEALEAIDNFCTTMQRLLETALRNAQADGDLASNKSPADLASYIMCCIHGLVLYGRHPSKKSAIPKLHETIFQSIVI